jgi:hypothetical protein
MTTMFVRLAETFYVTVETFEMTTDLSAGYKVKLVPTVDGASRPGMAFSISYFARQPVQWPGMSTRGFSFVKSATVSPIHPSLMPTR